MAQSVPQAPATSAEDAAKFPELVQAVEDTFGKKLELPPLMMQGGDIKGTAGFVGGAYGEGLKKSYLPPLGEVVSMAPGSEKFEAYIYKTAKGNVGVIRIPQYGGDPADPDGDDLDGYAHSFANILTKMQAETSALVIDQLNNPGGSVLYLYGLAGMLTDTSLVTAKHSFVLDPTTLQDAIEMNEVLTHGDNRPNGHRRTAENHRSRGISIFVESHQRVPQLGTVCY